jgi:hypothetical protein
VGSDPLPVLQKIVQVSNVQLRKSDFGLNTVLTDIPNAALAAGGATSVPIDITAIDIHLSGTVGGAGFMRNPTSCGTKTTKFTATSWANPNQSVTGQAAYTSVNCASLPFSPTFRAWLGAPGRTEFNTKPPMTTLIAQDDGEAGLKDAQVLLPSGSLSANVTPLLNPCGANRFRSDSSRCPRQSIVGTATAGSPFLPAPLSGRVVVVVPPPRGGLWRLGVDLHGPIDLQLLGDFVATATGLGQKFSRLPDIPISAFLLHFKQGGLLVADRDLCEPPAPVFPLDFLGWNSATQTSNVAATVQGCGG